MQYTLQTTSGSSSSTAWTCQRLMPWGCAGSRPGGRDGAGCPRRLAAQRRRPAGRQLLARHPAAAAYCQLVRWNQESLKETYWL